MNSLSSLKVTEDNVVRTYVPDEETGKSGFSAVTPLTPENISWFTVKHPDLPRLHIQGHGDLLKNSEWKTSVVEVLLEERERLAALLSERIDPQYQDFPQHQMSLSLHIASAGTETFSWSKEHRWQKKTSEHLQLNGKDIPALEGETEIVTVVRGIREWLLPVTSDEKTFCEERNIS